MLYIPIALAIGAVAGLARGGRLSNLAHASFRWPALLVIGAAVQAVTSFASVGGASTALLVASYAALAAFALANVPKAGMLLVALGVILNGIVIGVNGGMPVKAEAVVAAGLARDVEEAESLEFRGKRHLATEEDRLMILADIVPVPLGGGVVLSYGDLVLSLGAAVVVDGLLRKRRIPNIPS